LKINHGLILCVNYFFLGNDTSASSSYKGFKIDESGLGRKKVKERVIKRVNKKYQMVEHGRIFDMWKYITVEKVVDMRSLMKKLK